MRRNLHLLLAVILLPFLLPASSFAHGGGLDSHGGHNDRKNGGYHCHRGPLAGQSFSSKAEMLKQLRAQPGQGAEKKPGKKK
jgi:hypothetical protein